MKNQHKKITEREPCPTPPEIEIEKAKRVGMVCPNCGGALEGHKCKLLCTRRGCGYVVTCGEF